MCWSFFFLFGSLVFYCFTFFLLRHHMISPYFTRMEIFPQPGRCIFKAWRAKAVFRAKRRGFFRPPMSQWKKGAVGCSLGVQKGDEILPSSRVLGFIGEYLIFWVFLPPISLGKWSHLTSISFKRGGSTTTQFFLVFLGEQKIWSPIRKNLNMH